MRIDKFLSECKVATRRESGAAIRRGQVLLDGAAVKRADTQVDPEKSEVIFCGERVIYRRYTYVLLNKPDGVVSATEDAHERTVLDLLPPEVRKFELFPCGRLDKNTLGLLLLTNDGELANKLTHPRHSVPKIYNVEVDGKVGLETVKKLSGEMVIDGYKIQPVATSVIKMRDDPRHPSTVLRMELYEGRNRQIRKMCEICGLEVKRLTRVAIGDLRLANLKPGEWRHLTKSQVAYLKDIK